MLAVDVGNLVRAGVGDAASGYQYCTNQLVILYCTVRIRLISKMVAHTRLPSVAFRSGSRFLAVSLQVT